MSGTGAPTAGARPKADREAAPWRSAPWAAIGGTVVAGILLPQVLARISIGDYLITLMILFFMQAVVAQSWNLIMGYGGIYSFAQVALFAVGGWTTAVLASSLGWNPFVAMLFSPVVALLAAVGIGLPTLRLRGVYVVLLTLAFHELARVFTVTGPRFISGGGYGLVSVPTFSFGNAVGQQRTIYLYYLAMLIFVIATFIHLARDPLAARSGRDRPSRLRDLRGEQGHQPVPHPADPLCDQRLPHRPRRRLHDPLQRRHLDLGCSTSHASSTCSR